MDAVAKIIGSVSEKIIRGTGQYNSPLYRVHPDIRLPDQDKVTASAKLIRSALFPGYFTKGIKNPAKLDSFVRGTFAKAEKIILPEIERAYCFFCTTRANRCSACRGKAKKITAAFFQLIPDIQTTLETDVRAAFNGDPAASSCAEVIMCYPGLTAITFHRIAHALNRMTVPLLPRIISEYAHSITGIDIHPGAKIGHSFFIDHGTGVVIGETCVIGNGVKIYQGVTLGAKSFPLDKLGNPIKGIKRHPDIGDGAVIYANATVLGAIKVGENACIAGNSWVTHDVPANATAR